MPRLIDADAYLQNMYHLYELLKERYGEEEATKGLHFSFRDCIENISGEPTVDAVSVVRCVDCKWWKCADESEIIRYGDCTHPSSAIRKNCLPNETWFCADGERSET